MSTRDNTMLRAVGIISTYGMTGDGRRLPQHMWPQPRERSADRHDSPVRAANRKRRRRKGW